MARNVEIKAQIAPEQFENLRRRAEQIKTDGPLQLVQTDTFFETNNGRLKLREFSDGPAELIFYQRPDFPGPKTSRYIRSTCASPATMKEALGEANGIIGVVKKNREVFFVDQTRVHLDRVEGLGTYLELEVVLDETDPVQLGETVARDLMQQLGVELTQLVSGAYLDLLVGQVG